MVSVILCHHKGTRFIKKCIKSLKLSVGVKIEIIVVTSFKNMKIYGVTCIHSIAGPAQKRNIGAKHAKGEVLAFLDDDTEVNSDCLYEMVKVLKRPKVGMVYGKTLNMEHRTRFDGAGSFVTNTGFLWAREENGIEDTGQYDKIEPVFAGKGASMMLRRSTFNRCGGFEPYYEILAEETDISWQVWMIGQRVMWAPKAVLYHAFNTKFKPTDYYTQKRVYYNGCRNYIFMLVKYMEWGNVIKIVPFHMAVWFMAGVLMALRGRPSAALHLFWGLASNFKNFKKLLERRMIVQKKRKVSDKELFKVIMKRPGFKFYIGRLINYIKTGRHGAWVILLTSSSFLLS